MRWSHDIARRLTAANSRADGPRLPVRVIGWIAVAAASLTALALRYAVVGFKSPDYRIFLTKWYAHLSEQGFSGFKVGFSDYNPPYLYLLWICSALGLPDLVAIKGISIGFDLVLACSVWYLLRSWGQEGLRAALGAVLVLFVPTVWLNSATWGQCDAIYTSMLVLTLATWKRGHHGWSWLLLGVAVAFKLQAVFMLPVMGLLWLLDRRQPWWAPALAAIAPVLAPLPTVMAGRPWADAYSIYADQASVFFVYGAPTFMAWIGAKAALVGHAGVYLMIGLLVLALAAAVVVHQGRLDCDVVLAMTAFTLLLAPFLLPVMRDRYLFPAEVFVIVWTLVRGLPRIYLPFLVTVPLLWSYSKVLFSTPLPVSIGLATVPILAALVVLLSDTLTVRRRVES